MNIKKKTSDFRLEVKTTLAQKNITKPRAQVGLVMDISASMSNLYRSGAVQVASRQAAALGLEFDDDGVIPCVAFHKIAKKLKPITQSNADNFYQNLKPNGVGTNYTPALQMIVKECGGGTTSLFGSLFGKKNKVEDPIFIIFITDGNCSDSNETTRYLKKLSETVPVFIQFVGIGNERFTYLQKLDDLPGRKIDNAGFCAVRDGVSLTIDDLLNEFPEYCETLEQMRSSGSIKY